MDETTNTSVTLEATSAPAANESAPKEGRSASLDLGDFTRRIAAEMVSDQPASPESKGNQEKAGQDTPPAEPEATAPADQPTDPDQDHDKAQWPQAAVERIRKLKEQRAKAREESEQLRSRIAELEKSSTKPAPEVPKDPLPTDGPLDNIASFDQLQQTTEQAQKTLDNAVNLLERSVDDIEEVEKYLRDRDVKIGPEGTEWTPKNIRDFLRAVKDDAQKVLRAAPRRQEYLSKESQAIEWVEQNFPTYADEQSEDFRLAASVVKEFPELRKRPDWMAHAIIYAEGYKVHQARGKQAAKATKPAAAAAPRLPGAPTAAPRTVERDGLATAAGKLSSGKGTIKDAQEYARAAVRGATR